MKTSSAILLSCTGAAAFICSYFFNLTLDNAEQYLGLIAVMFLDGFFGILAGMKREGFQTCKALKVLRTTATWIVILTVLLMVEKGFKGTAWLSETILMPFLIFQLISALKNASMVGLIKSELLNTILDKIDNHKGERDLKSKK
jgi:phage-related holin